MYGKGQILRLCGVLQVLEITLQEINKITDFISVSREQIIIEVEKIKFDSVMSSITVEKGNQLNDYNMSQKLMLSRYIRDQTKDDAFKYKYEDALK